MKSALVAGGLVTAALALAPTAQAAEMYMGGLFGVVPQMSTITLPDGEKCQTGCQHVTYDNISTQSAYNALSNWLFWHGASGNTVILYSESAAAGQQYLDNHPNDKNTWVLQGDPDDPGNGQTTNPLPTYTNPNPNVTFVTVQGDSVAQPTNKSATLATHVTGYNNLDESQPISSTPVAGSGGLNNLYNPGSTSSATKTGSTTTVNHPLVQLVQKVSAAIQTHHEAAEAKQTARHAKVEAKHAAKHAK